MKADVPEVILSAVQWSSVVVVYRRQRAKPLASRAHVRLSKYYMLRFEDFVDVTEKKSSKPGQCDGFRKVPVKNGMIK